MIQSASYLVCFGKREKKKREKKTREKKEKKKVREKKCIKSFKDSDTGIQILIVVDKLLTGFDAPNAPYPAAAP